MTLTIWLEISIIHYVRIEEFLAELNPKDKTKTSRDRLLSKGFSFNYFTHTYETKTGSIYHFCYEMGYLELENDEVLLVKREKEL